MNHASLRPVLSSPLLVSAAWASSPRSALAQSTQLDPPGSGPILNAVNWLQGALLGNVATALTVIAVGATGLQMLTGRIAGEGARWSWATSSCSVPPPSWRASARSRPEGCRGRGEE